MYEIKKVSYNRIMETVTVEEGIRVILLETGKVIPKPSESFWGQAHINFKEGIEFETLPEIIDERCSLLPYVSSFQTEEGLMKEQKKFTFEVEAPDEVQGYLLFLEQGFGIDTDGKILFDNPNQIVVLLEDNNFLEFDEQKLFVVGNELALRI